MFKFLSPHKWTLMWRVIKNCLTQNTFYAVSISYKLTGKMVIVVIEVKMFNQAIT